MTEGSKAEAALGLLYIMLKLAVFENIEPI